MSAITVQIMPIVYAEDTQKMPTSMMARLSDGDWMTLLVSLFRSTERNPTLLPVALTGAAILSDVFPLLLFVRYPKLAVGGLVLFREYQYSVSVVGTEK